jgi:threonine/homoserine/homoserine lactone efflux protein
MDRSLTTYVFILVAGHAVTAHGVVFSIICFVTGAYLCFLGGKKKKKNHLDDFTIILNYII